MHHYVVQYGDSPHSIARRFGIHVRQLIEANPSKPVVYASGQQTWSALYPGERLRIPHRHDPYAPPPPPPQVPWWQQQQQQAWWQPPPPPQVPWWQQQQQQVPAWQTQALWQPQVQQRHWRRPPPPQRQWHPGHFRFGPVHGVADPVESTRRAIHEELLRRINWGRRGYEHGDYPYGVADAGLGDPVSDAVNALLSAGDPCDPSNASLVCAAQTALGIGADGKWGAGTAKAAQAVVPGAPGPCTPRPSWWAPAGQSNCGGGAPLIMPTITIPGTPPAAPPAAPPATPPPDAPVAPPPAAAPSAPPALQALAGLDPCAAANVNLVCAAQSALGIQADGKWGAGTAKAAQAVFPGAPGPCTPRPGWWAPAGQSNCGGAPPSSGLPPVPPPTHGGPHALPGVIPTAPGALPIAPPESHASVVPGGIKAPKDGGSTLAIAGVLGVVALAAVVGVVATGGHPEQIITRYRTRRVPVPAPAPAHRRAPAHHRAPARKSRSRRTGRR